MAGFESQRIEYHHGQPAFIFDNGKILSVARTERTNKLVAVQGLFLKAKSEYNLDSILSEYQISTSRRYANANIAYLDGFISYALVQKLQNDARFDFLELDTSATVLQQPL